MLNPWSTILKTIAEVVISIYMMNFVSAQPSPVQVLTTGLSGSSYLDSILVPRFVILPDELILVRVLVNTPMVIDGVFQVGHNPRELHGELIAHF